MFEINKTTWGSTYLTKLPAHPCEKVASDLFRFENPSWKVVRVLKNIFARHGVPSTLISENGPQYDSKEMKEFAKKYGFTQVTTSPHHPQANGQAVNKMLANSSDPHKALLRYGATPLPQYVLSPAELLMGRRTRTDVPVIKQSLVPDWPHIKGFREVDKKSVILTKGTMLPHSPYFQMRLKYG